MPLPPSRVLQFRLGRAAAEIDRFVRLCRPECEKTPGGFVHGLVRDLLHQRDGLKFALERVGDVLRREDEAKAKAKADGVDTLLVGPLDFPVGSVRCGFARREDFYRFGAGVGTKLRLYAAEHPGAVIYDLGTGAVVSCRFSKAGEVYASDVATGYRADVRTYADMRKHPAWGPGGLKDDDDVVTVRMRRDS
jgi:hypothetical protein